MEMHYQDSLIRLNWLLKNYSNSKYTNEEHLIKLNWLLQKQSSSKYTYYHSDDKEKCMFCDIETNCFFYEKRDKYASLGFANIIYNKYYVCESTYQQITSLHKHMMLFNILSEKLDTDTTKIIHNLLLILKLPNVRCIENKNNIIKYRKWYLKESFNNYTVNQLDQFFAEHNIKKPKNKRKAEYLNILKVDVQKKKKEWYKENNIYPIR